MVGCVKHQISCGNFIAETKKYVYLNDIAIDSLNPRYDLHNNNGGHVKNVTFLQDNECDLLEAIKESKTVIAMLRAERQDESV
jgi:hypothetical protein